MFEILEHPSDVGVRACAPSKEQALLDLSRGLISIMVNTDAIGTTEERVFRAHGGDHASQVVDWLNEILFYFDTEGFVPVDLQIHAWTDQEIAGVARGGFFDPSRHELRTSVKAATYHQFESRSTPDGWEIRVYVDV